MRNSQDSNVVAAIKFGELFQEQTAKDVEQDKPAIEHHLTNRLYSG